MSSADTPASDENKKSVQDMSSKFANSSKQVTLDIADFQTALSKSINNVLNKFEEMNQVIWTQSLDKKTEYKTTISGLCSIKTDFQLKEPDPNDIYWITHQKRVNDALELRKAFLAKVIETTADAIKGIVGKA